MPDNPRDNATPHSSDSHQLDWMTWRPGSATAVSGAEVDDAATAYISEPEASEADSDAVASEATTVLQPASSDAAPTTLSLKKASAAAPTLPPESPTPAHPSTPTTSGWEVTQAAPSTSNDRLYTPPATPTAPPQSLYSAPPHSSQPYSQQYPSPYPPIGQPQSKSSWLPIGIGLVLVVTLIVGGAVWAATKGPLKANNSSSDSATGGGAQNLPDTLTTCSRPLTISSPQTSLTSAGLNVTFTASSPCAGGDVLSGSQVAATTSSSAGPVAEGIFDLSSSPIGVPPQPGSRQITLTYPTGSFYQLPDTIGSDLTVQVTNTGTTGTSTLSSSQATGPASATASQGTTPTGANVDDVAAQSLRAQANADRTKVLSTSNNQWVAQLSSKQPDWSPTARRGPTKTSSTSLPPTTNASRAHDSCGATSGRSSVRPAGGSPSPRRRSPVPRPQSRGVSSRTSTVIIAWAS